MPLSENSNDQHAEIVLTKKLGVKDPAFINSGIMIVSAMIFQQVKKKYDNAKSKYRRSLTKCELLT